MLEDVEVTRPGIPAPIHHDTLEWTAGPDRSLLRPLSAYPRALSFQVLLRLPYQPGVGSSPPYLYQFWFPTKLAVPVATVLIVFLAVKTGRAWCRERVCKYE